MAPHPLLHTIEVPDLGHRCYLVGDGTVAAVVDPARGDDVLGVADRLGVRITHVLETHLHEDHLTGAIDIVARTGARYVVPAGTATAEIPLATEEIGDGERIALGRVTLMALMTPGHSPHHAAYVVEDDGPVAVLTGGSLSFSTVGRVDLVDENVAEWARAQFRSVRRLAAILPGDVEVLPGHVAPSYCLAGVRPPVSGARIVGATLDDEKRRNTSLAIDEEIGFVRRMQALHTDVPPQFAETRAANRAGGARPSQGPGPATTLTDVWIRLADQEWVVDVRPRDEFAAAHFPGSVNIPLGEEFALTLPWLVDPDEPVTLLGGSGTQIEEAWRALGRVRATPPVAWFLVDPARLGEDARSFPVAGFHQLAARLGQGQAVTVVDVRRSDEWRQGHVPEAIRIPLADLEEHLDEIPDRPLWVHCSTGYRAAVGASLLARRGRQVVLVDGDWETVGARTLDVVLA